jgi:hypothetical protein
LNRMIFCWVLGFTRDNTNLVKGCCETIGGWCNTRIFSLI